MITIFIISADYQSAKAARRVSKKGQGEHEKIRHESNTSHCSSEKSVGEFDAAESLIVLSSATTNQQDQSPTNHLSLPSREGYGSIKVEQDEIVKAQSNFSYGNVSCGKMNLMHTTHPIVSRTTAETTNVINGSECNTTNPMDLSPANSSHILPFKPQNVSPSASLINEPKQSLSSQSSGSNQRLSLPTSQPQQPSHRQVMTVTPVADHVALVDTVLNAPSMPTMVIPMDDDLEQHKIQHVNPSNVVFSRNNMNGSKLSVSEGR